jgi:hypothetical protein
MVLSIPLQQGFPGILIEPSASRLEMAISRQFSAVLTSCYKTFFLGMTLQTKDITTILIMTTLTALNMGAITCYDITLILLIAVNKTYM